MRVRLLLIALGAVPFAAVAAQSPGPDSLAARHAVFTVGLGNSYAGIGGAFEGFLYRSRLSAFASVGYIPEVNASDGRVAATGGIRAYTGGSRHRVFLEGAFAPLIADQSLASAPIPYGPSLALGYAYTSRSGFTLSLSRGIGWATSRHRTVAVGNFGIGYTWRY